MKKLTRAVIGSVLVVGCWAAPARADDSAHDKAVTAFQEGRRYLEAGNCDGAVTKLRESLSFEPSVGARLSLADCLEATDPLAAWRALKDAANLAYINADDRLPLAETHAAALEKRLPTIRVSVPQATLEQPGFELRVDGVLVDKFHYRTGVIATKPGKHVVEASAPLRHWSQQVDAETGGGTQVSVLLERDTCSSNPASDVAAPPTEGKGCCLAGSSDDQGNANACIESLQHYSGTACKAANDVFLGCLGSTDDNTCCWQSEGSNRMNTRFRAGCDGGVEACDPGADGGACSTGGACTAVKCKGVLVGYCGGGPAPCQ